MMSSMAMYPRRSLETVASISTCKNEANMNAQIKLEIKEAKANACSVTSAARVHVLVTEALITNKPITTVMLLS